MGRPRKNPLPDQQQTNQDIPPMPDLRDEPKMVEEEKLTLSSEDNANAELGTLTLPTDEASEPTKKAWKRNKGTGLLENYEYIKKEDGSIDWLAMIPQEYFVAKGRGGEQDVSKLKNEDKLILRAGWWKIAAIRGYRRIVSNVLPYSRPDNIALQTLITWVANDETDGEERTTEGFADAHYGNVNSAAAKNGYVGTNFLLTTAENRAYARAVRKELQIPVLSQDEISSGDEGIPRTTAPGQDDNAPARKNLQKVLDSVPLAFDQFKNAMTKHVANGLIKDIDVQNWETINDIPGEKLFEVTTFLEQRLKAKK